MKTYKIAITTGDKKGIGKEITKKALDALNLDKDDIIIIGEKIDVDYDFIEINETDNGTFCYKSLEKACELAKNKIIKGIITSPVSKYELHKAGYKYNGQTEILEKLLLEFPVEEVNLCLPDWLDSLDISHWLKCKLIESMKEIFCDVKNMKNVTNVIKNITE